MKIPYKSSESQLWKAFRKLAIKIKKNLNQIRLRDW